MAEIERTDSEEYEAAESLLGQIADEFAECMERGEVLDVQEYAARHPALAETLRRVLPALQLIHAHPPSSSIQPPPRDPPSPTTKRLGDFRLIREVGRGGMGIVYEAEQLSLERRVALKVLPMAGILDDRQLARFKNEARAAATLLHPHIIPVYAVGSDAGTHFYAMQFIDGASLAEIIVTLRQNAERAVAADQHIGTQSSEEKNSGARPEDNAARVTPQNARAAAAGPPRQRLTRNASGVQKLVDGQAILHSQGNSDTASIAGAVTALSQVSGAGYRGAARLAADVAEALDYAHSMGIVHRDIKPGNLLLDWQGKVWIADFGLAQLEADAGLTMTGDVLGTLRYMSPEQAGGRSGLVDARSDVYSLGLTLYELLTMRSAFPAKERNKLIQQISSEDPPRPRQSTPSIPRDLETIVLKAIAKSPQDRYPTAGEFAADLRRFLADKPILAKPPGLWEIARKWRRRNHAAVATALTTLVLAIALAGTFLLRERNATLAALAAEHEQRAAAELNSSLAQQKASELAELVYAKDMLAATKHYLNGEQPEFERILQRHEIHDRASLRGFEWYFVKGLMPVETKVLFETEERIYDFVMTADGKGLIYGDSGGNLVFVELISGNRLGEFKWDHEPIYAVELSDEGNLLWAGETGKVGSWQVDETLDLTPQSTVPPTQATILSLASHGNVQWAGDDRGRVFQWNGNSGQIQPLGDWALREKIRDMVVAPDGAVIAAHHHELFEMRVDPTEANGLSSTPWRLPLSVTLQEIRDMDLSHDKDLLVCAQLLGGVSVFKLTKSQPELLFTHLLPDDVHSVAISPDGEWVAAGDASGHIHVLSTQLRHADSFLDRSTSRARQWRSWLAHDDKIEHLVFHAGRDSGVWEIISGGRDGRLVVSRPFADSSNRFLAIEDHVDLFSTAASNCEVLWSHQRFDLTLHDARFQNGRVGHFPLTKSLKIQPIAGANAIALLVDERTLARMPKAESGVEEVLWETGAESRAVRVALAQGGRHFAICLETSKPTRHSIEIYRTGSRHSLHSIPSNLANDMTFSPSGDVLAFVCNNDIALVDVRTAERLELLRLHTDSIQDIAFSPDGKQLASVSNDRRLAVWDVESGKLVWSHQAHKNRAVAVAFHPMLPTLASVGADSVVRFWSNRGQVADDSVRLVGEFPLRMGSCEELDFSEDGKSLFIHHVALGVTELRAAFD